MRDRHIGSEQGEGRRAQRPARRALLALLLLGGAAAARPALAEPDPFALSLPELLEVRIYGASKFLQSTGDAPASVSVLTADELRSFGFRTLGEALDGVRGVYVNQDRNYSFVGMRGVSRPSDYNARLLLLVDGNRYNDPIFDIAFVGHEFPIDIEQIERIEIIRGPGSSVYGSNAFLGVINVVTKTGAMLQGGEAAVEAGTAGRRRLRAALGARTATGLDWRLSASRYRQEGEDLYFPEFDQPENNGGIAEGLDGERADHYSARLSFGRWSASAAFADRTKQVPTASFGSAFNDPRLETWDQTGHATLAYTRPLGGRWEFSPRLFFGNYRYHGTYPTVTDDGVTLNHDHLDTTWWGSELKLTGIHGRHQLIAGLEYQDNLHQHQENHDEDPHRVHLDDERSSRRSGIYLQDDVSLDADWTLSAGLRVDDYSTVGSSVNPRLGLLWHPSPRANFKLLYGTAFRAPNSFELYYHNARNGDPLPEAERIRSYEFVAEYLPDPGWRLTLDVYRNEIRDLISPVSTGDDDSKKFVNLGQVISEGVELEAERVWSRQLRARASYAWQQSRDPDSNALLQNSPRHAANLRLSAPLWNEAVQVGTELQYLSHRRSFDDARVPSRLITNLTVTTREFGIGYELQASVRNLLDRDNADPGRPEHVQDLLARDGRSFWLGLTYRYR